MTPLKIILNVNICIVKIKKNEMECNTLLFDEPLGNIHTKLLSAELLIYFTKIILSLGIAK